MDEKKMDEKKEDRIRRRAYQIWENEGRPNDRAEEHWRQASQLEEAQDEPQTGPPTPTLEVAQRRGNRLAGRASAKSERARARR